MVPLLPPPQVHLLTMVDRHLWHGVLGCSVWHNGWHLFWQGVTARIWVAVAEGLGVKLHRTIANKLQGKGLCKLWVVLLRKTSRFRMFSYCKFQGNSSQRQHSPSQQMLIGQHPRVWLRPSVPFWYLTNAQSNMAKGLQLAKFAFATIAIGPPYSLHTTSLSRSGIFVVDMGGKPERVTVGSLKFAHLDLDKACSGGLATTSGTNPALASVLIPGFDVPKDPGPSAC